MVEWQKHGDFGSFPAVQWKLHNITRLKAHNPTKHRQEIKRLKTYFGITE